MTLAGKRILLTGASGGIGRAVVLALARAGAHLALVSRDGERLQGLARLARGLGVAVTALEFDLASATGHDTLVSQAAHALGGLDVLVNNAGVQRYVNLADDDAAPLAALVAINFTAPLLLTRAALPVLRAAAGGATIVNVGSTFGAIAHPGFAAYSATKFALRGLSEALRRELADTNVRVAYVSPRATDTPMNTPEIRRLQRATGARMDAPEVVADSIVAAVTGGPTERQLGGPERLFVRLNALFPRLVDRALVRQHRDACARQSPRIDTGQARSVLR